MATFINRQKEIKFLKNWVEEEPNSLLFVYGPKSSGKTTLIKEVIDKHLNTKKISVNYMNLRGILLYNFESFLESFFVKTKTEKIKDLLGGVSINIPYFKVGLNDEALFKKNPFRIMEGQLTKAQKKGLQPVLIIDEIQNLKNIYMNGERLLLDQLFNLFVRLTKSIHVAHVILLTSDSYFVEEIYQNARLSKTTTYFFINHLEKNAVREWLLEEKLGENSIATIWKYLGGSPWEITQCLRLLKQGQNVNEVCQNIIQNLRGQLAHYIFRNFQEDEENTINQVHQNIIKKSYCNIQDLKGLNIIPILQKMVDQNFWFYKTDEQKILANSESIRWAMKRL